MDNTLQQLKRQLKQEPSNIALIEQIAVQECRLSGHHWTLLPDSYGQWLQIKLCLVCRATQGIPFFEINSPKELTLTVNVTHRIASIGTPYDCYECGKKDNSMRIFTSCSDQFFYPANYVLAQQYETAEITCKTCVKIKRSTKERVEQMVKQLQKFTNLNENW